MSANLFVFSSGEDYRDHEAELLRFLTGQVQAFNPAAWHAFGDASRDAGFTAVFVASVMLVSNPTASDRFYRVAEELLGLDLTAENFGAWLRQTKLQAPRLAQGLLDALYSTHDGNF